MASFITFGKKLSLKEVEKKPIKVDVEVKTEADIKPPTNSPDYTKEEKPSESEPEVVEEFSDVEPELEVEPGSAPKMMSGRTVLKKYILGEPVAIATYAKICQALEMLPRWEEASRLQFLEQMMNTTDLLDHRCSSLVGGLTRLPWEAIPAPILTKFQSLLCDIGVRQVCHTKRIYEAAVRNLVPAYKKNEETKEYELVLGEEQWKTFAAMGHQMIAHLLKCFPTSKKELVQLLKKSAPNHYSCHCQERIEYVRAMVQIGEYSVTLRADIWTIIIEFIVTIDSQLTQRIRKNEDTTADIFVLSLNENKEEEREQTPELEMAAAALDRHKTLDGIMRDLVAVLGSKSGAQLAPEFECSWLKIGSSTPTELFELLLAALEDNMLMNVHVRYVSFLWLYLGSLDETYATRLLDFLWSVVCRPQRAQSDAKKAHGAAAYLAAFLARAKYIDLPTAFSWLSRMVAWCVNYLDKCSSVSVMVAGGIRHGVFYALSQAIFIVFCFRYKEIVKSGDLEDVRRWGLSRFVLSPLEPLHYVSKPVALCFATITRSLQLVYCNHVVGFRDDSAPAPFEHMFPLDTYQLPISERLMGCLMRRFSPLAEDVAVLFETLYNKTGKGKKVAVEETGMEFLDEDDTLIGTADGPFRERLGSNGIQCGTQSSLFTVYSSTPGLRHFDSPMDMR